MEKLALGPVVNSREIAAAKENLVFTTKPVEFMKKASVTIIRKDCYLETKVSKI